MALPRTLAWLVAAALLAAAPVRSEDAAAAAETPSCIGKARLRGSSFEPGSATLKPSDLAVLDLVVEALNGRCAGKQVTIEGHVRASGEPGRDQQLSQARAEAVKRRLVERGVAAERLRTVGYGSTRPQTSDPKLADLNERIAFVVEGE